MDESLKQYYDMINQQQQANNAWSAEQAQKAMDYQTEMSNTAHQREVADLKAAGLNPVLSAGGQGATTSTGHAAQAGNENVTALYGLMQQQIKSQTDIAKAAINSARYYSSGSTVAAPFSFGSPILDGALAVAEDFLKRKTGIQPDHVNQLLGSLGDLIQEGQFLNTYDPVASSYNTAPSAKQARDAARSYDQKLRQQNSDGSLKTPAEQKGKVRTMGQTKTAAAAGAIALAFLLGKGLSGGSYKGIKRLTREFNKY